MTPSVSSRAGLKWPKHLLESSDASVVMQLGVYDMVLPIEIGFSESQIWGGLLLGETLVNHSSLISEHLLHLFKHKL